MLVLTRKLDEIIRIGDDITIVVAKIDRDRVRIGVEAPRGVPIVRGELGPIDPREGERGRNDG